VATAAIIDSQSVKTSGNVTEASQGIDAGKKVKGRERHVATDVLGLLLVAIVTAASVQDSAGGHEVLDRHPRGVEGMGGRRLQQRTPTLPRDDPLGQR
jgi:Transposase DDE domain